MSHLFSDGCGSEGNVFQNFSHDSANAQHDRWTKLLINQKTSNEFSRPRHHGCDENMHVTVFRRGCIEQLGCRILHCIGVGKTKLYETPFGFMGNGVTAQLCDNRKTNLFGGGYSLGSRTDPLLWGKRNSVGGEEFFRVGFGEGTRCGHGSIRYSS